jgi:hypothetical protein
VSRWSSHTIGGWLSSIVRYARYIATLVGYLSCAYELSNARFCSGVNDSTLRIEASDSREFLVPTKTLVKLCLLRVLWEST